MLLHDEETTATCFFTVVFQNLHSHGNLPKENKPTLLLGIIFPQKSPPTEEKPGQFKRNDVEQFPVSKINDDGKSTESQTSNYAYFYFHRRTVLKDSHASPIKRQILQT